MKRKKSLDKEFILAKLLSRYYIQENNPNAAAKCCFIANYLITELPKFGLTITEL